MLQYYQCDDPSGRVVEGVDLRPLTSWDCGFESLKGHVCLSDASVMCQLRYLHWADLLSRVVLPAVVCLIVIETTGQLLGPGSLGVVSPWKRKSLLLSITILILVISIPCVFINIITNTNTSVREVNPASFNPSTPTPLPTNITPAVPHPHHVPLSLIVKRNDSIQRRAGILMRTQQEVNSSPNPPVTCIIAVQPNYSVTSVLPSVLVYGASDDAK